MGMYDESWCASCGAGMHYTADESAECGKCAGEEYNKLNTRSSKFMEYIKIHLISLEQDLEKYQHEYIYKENDDVLDLMVELSGQIKATKHLLSVATDIMNSSNERVYV
jgi:hypothetical protein